MFQLKLIASFDEALEHAERLRAQMPKTYNPARECEQPIPSIAPPTLDMYSSNDGSDGNNEVEQEEVQEETIDEEHQEDARESTHGVDESDPEDVKPRFEDVFVADKDSNAFHAIFSAANNPAEPHVENAESQIQPNDSLFEADEMNLSTGGKKTLVFDDDLECVYDSESDFKPMLIDDGYIIKPNDMLSNNWAFKTNVTFFYRSFNLPVWV